MGWGSKLLHGAEIAGGVALIAGTGGAATPWALPVIAGGAGGLVQDFAGDSAQKTQQAATDAASAANKAALDRQSAILGPYAGAGNAALGNLASLMGGTPFGLPAGAQAQGPTLTQGPGVRDASQGTPTGQTAVPRDPNAVIRLADGSIVPASSLAALNRSSVRTA